MNSTFVYRNLPVWIALFLIGYFVVGRLTQIVDAKYGKGWAIFISIVWVSVCFGIGCIIN